MKKIFCAFLIIFGIALDTYFYSFRFLADGLPLVIAVSSGISLELLLAFSVYNARRSKVFIAIAVAITVYAVVQTSAGQTFALLSHTVNTGSQTVSSTAEFTIETCKKNVERLTSEADAINSQLKSLRSAEDRANYSGTIYRATQRLESIERERVRNMDVLLKTSSATVTEARNGEERKSIYNFYSSIPSWSGSDWMKFLFHFVLSVLIAIMAPVGIITWGTPITQQATYSKQQIEMFVAAAWYKIRNNTGVNILSEVAFNELLQRRGHTIESGIYFALTNRCSQLGLINAAGVALEKDHHKVIKKLLGEKESTALNVFKSVREKVKTIYENQLAKQRCKT